MIVLEKNEYSEIVAIDSDTMLRHNRIGHMSEKGMKCVNMDLYESCVYGKQKRVSFVKSGKENKKEKLELVHTDVWGPAQVSSLRGSHYYVTFIDDTTRKAWVYFLRHKSDVFQTF